MSTYRGLTPVLHSVLNVKALVGSFKQEKALEYPPLLPSLESAGEEMAPGWAELVVPPKH